MFWRLAYRDRFVAALEQELPEGAIPETGYAPFNFPEEGAYLQFFFTAETFKHVYTALLNGADLTYGERSTEVVWSFLRNVEYPIMPDCSDTLDCIEDSTPIQQLIQEIVQQGVGPVPTTEVVGPDTAGNDALFGMIRFLVDTMHDAIVDVFQIAEQESGLRERVTLLFEAIPALELLPIDEIASYADDLFNEIGSLFDEQWTTVPVTGIRDRISCALYCLAKDNGNTLTWAMIRDHFWGVVGYETTLPSQFQAFVGYLLTGTWAGDDIVNISFANLAAALDASGRYGELVFPSFVTLSKLGTNDPDPDWSILCTDCGGGAWCFEQDTKETVTSIELVYSELGIPYASEFVSGTGIIGARAGFLDENIPKYNMPSPARVTEIAFDVTVSDASNAYAFMFPNGDTSWTPQALVPGVNTLVFTVDEDVDFIQFGVDRAGLDRSAIGPITRVRVKGTGTNPFGVSNC